MALDFSREEIMKRTSLNHVYRIVWSRVLDAWVAVAEITRARGKTATTSHRRLTSVVAALLSLSTALAQAAPTGGQIAAGTGSIAQSASTTTVQQGSPKLSVNWASFNVAAQETVNYVQPSAAAIAVNRIFDTNGSQILGQLNANGQVYLINPNGIVFGHGAQVNVGGLVASTLDLNDASLNGDTRRFSGNGNGSVVNRGTINAARGGYIALLGNQVSNHGVISAQLGTVALGAGSAATLTFGGNSLVAMQVDQSVLNSLAENGGLIRADGGTVLMTAGARNALLASVVNNTGVVEARTVEDHAGTIVLLGGMQAGQAQVGGTLDASAPNGGNGGFIETSAAHVKVASDARVTTAAPLGSYGTWLIDPQDFSVAASGGDMSGATLSANLGSTPVTIQSSGGGSAGSGNINVDDAVSWSADTTLTLTAAKHVNVTANIAATGNAAGVAINANTANGGEAASGDGTFNLNNGASVTLSGANPSLGIGGTAYTVINSLGVEGDTSGTTLQGMSGNLAGHYALGTDIDATPTAGWNGGAGFAPVGTYYNYFTYLPFAGTFDGLGHSIGNLVINRPGSGGMGMFGVGSATSVIRNVGLVGGSVTGNYGVGFLMGYNEAGSAINNTYTTGVVTATGWSGGSDGGLVGFNRGAISNSYATGNVSGSTSVGGLVGSNTGLISNSHATGTVTGSGSNGGLVGGGGGIISDSYATGNVNGSGSYVGGLVGAGSATISNSYATGNVSSSGSSVGGLAGASGGTISNSHATGTVSGSGDSVGGLVGSNGAAIDNSYATGNVSGTGSYVGGLVGYNAATISDSNAAGNVSGGTSVGGLVGRNVEGTITDSYATGEVTGSWGSIGGLVGYNSGDISHSYATGNVFGSGRSIGGLVGSNENSTISDSYAAGEVSGSSNYVGGLVGYNYYGTTITNSYFAGNVSGTGNYIGGLVGGSNYDYGYAITNSHYDVETTTINGSHLLTVGGLYSAQYQDWLNHGMTLDIANYASSLPYDSASGYYRLNNVQGLKDLLGFADNPAYKFRLTGNIDLTGAPGLWIPEFSGTEFDGAGHTISNLSVNLPFAPFVGLFGTLSSGSTLTNLGIAGGSVLGLKSVGGLAGWSSGTITNSYATASVEETGEIVTLAPPIPIFASVGGLVGDNFGTIRNTYATGNVSGRNDVGGLVGYNEGTVSDSYATGSVSSTGHYVGGLVGYNAAPAWGYDYSRYSEGESRGYDGYGGAISNSYATGSVLGLESVGGLVGINRGSVSTSHATGNVTETGGQQAQSAGGLVGDNFGTVSDSYATGSVSGANAVGGLVGYNAGRAWGYDYSNYGEGESGAYGYSEGRSYDGYGYGGAISNSYATGSVLGRESVGGLVGINSGSVSTSYATGNVTETGGLQGDSAGGLVGDNFGTISDSYATGSISGANAVGGLVGYNAGTINTSYSAGRVSGTSNVGGLVGYNATGDAAGRCEEGCDASQVSNSFWDIQTSGQATSAGGTGMSSAQMQQQANFTSATSANGHVNPIWDFADTWVMYDRHAHLPAPARLHVATDGERELQQDLRRAALHGGQRRELFDAAQSRQPAGHRQP
jgi:filamentous hemagglutinin family protein